MNAETQDSWMGDDRRTPELAFDEYGVRLSGKATSCYVKLRTYAHDSYPRPSDEDIVARFLDGASTEKLEGALKRIVVKPADLPLRIELERQKTFEANGELRKNYRLNRILVVDNNTDAVLAVFQDRGMGNQENEDGAFVFGDFESKSDLIENINQLSEVVCAVLEEVGQDEDARKRFIVSEHERITPVEVAEAQKRVGDKVKESNTRDEQLRSER